MMKTRYMILGLLLVLGANVYSQEAPAVFKTNEFKIGLKTGRTFFTNPEELGGLSTHVFYGQVSAEYGVCRNNNVYYGAGIGGEYFDLLDAKISIPIFADLRYYFTGDAQKGAFLEVQAGYAFCSNQTFPINETHDGNEILVGQTVRKMSGPYGEISIGYRTQRFDFQVGYGYRAVNYTRTNYANPYNHGLNEQSFFKPMHTFMARVGYSLLRDIPH